MITDPSSTIKTEAAPRHPAGRRRGLLALAASLFGLVLLVTGCSQEPSDAEPEPPATTVPDQPATVHVRNVYNLGDALVGTEGRLLYMAVADTSTKSTCVGACVQSWPPLLTDGTPKAGKGVNSSLIGTTKRPDGTTQVTYAGHPLYRYIHDLVPGQGRGVGMRDLGTLWYALSPSGQALRTGGPVEGGY